MSRPELNGTTCRMLTLDTSTGRWIVQLPDDSQIKLKPSNLKTITYKSEEESAEKAAVRLEAQVRFQSIDTNGDGTLDALELSAALCDSGLTDNEIEALFFKLDSNSDNQVSALPAICC